MTKRCDLGSLGVPGAASAPLGLGPAVSVTKLLPIVANCYYLLLICCNLLLFVAIHCPGPIFACILHLPHLVRSSCCLADVWGLSPLRTQVMCISVMDPGAVLKKLKGPIRSTK